MRLQDEVLTVMYWNLIRGIFLGNIEGLRKTASSRINTHTDLKRIDETRGNITVEEGDLLVDERTLSGKSTLITRISTLVRLIYLVDLGPTYVRDD